MKRISIIGLCLMVVVAASAVSATSSSAALPEFKTSGGAFPVKFTSTNALPLLAAFHSSILESVINCQMTDGTGEIPGVKSIAKVNIIYLECKENATANSCTSGTEPAGTIKTNELLGRIGYIPPTLTTTKLVGAELEPIPSAGKIFAEFTCGGAAGKVTVEGCTIGEAKPTDEGLLSTGSLLFWENAGLNGQLYTLIDEGVHHPCEQIVTATVLKLKGKGWLMDDELEKFLNGINIELKTR